MSLASQQSHMNGEFKRNSSSHHHDVPVPMATETVWQALSAAPGIGVCVMSVDGITVYTSAEHRRIYWGDHDSTFDTSGLAFASNYPTEWVAERMGYVKRVVDERRPLAVRQVWRGHQILMVLRPVISAEGDVTHILCVSRPTESQDLTSQFEEVAESEFIELGELSVLTPRELVVLALLGQGLTLKEIAEKLHRSFKTIDNHRASIGRKLRKTDRLELAKLASQAGLRVRDAELQRVEHGVSRPKRA